MSNSKKRIAPSILSADFANLAVEVDKVIQAGADFLHVDVMDGHFVPNLTIGMPVVQSLKPHARIPMDVHLMIEKPEKYIEEFIKAGSQYLTIHVEATTEVEANLKKIRELGCKAGITARPGTSLEALKPFLSLVDLVLIMTVEPGFGGQKFMSGQLDKIRELADLKTKNNWNYLIEVDGGINPETSKLCWQAGADVLVAGSAVFNGAKSIENYKSNIEKLR